MPVPQYDFLVDTYGTERLKTLSVWFMFADADLAVRPHAVDRRGRSFLEQIHQCVSENLWFCNIHGIDVDAPPLPDAESLAFLRRYADDAARRSDALRTQDDGWWSDEVAFFEVGRSRAWVLTRRSPTPPTTAASSPICCACWAATCTAPTDPQRIPADFRRTSGGGGADDLRLPRHRRAPRGRSPRGRQSVTARDDGPGHGTPRSRRQVKLLPDEYESPRRYSALGEQLGDVDTAGHKYTVTVAPVPADVVRARRHLSPQQSAYPPPEQVVDGQLRGGTRVQLQWDGDAGIEGDSERRAAAGWMRGEAQSPAGRRR